MRRGYNYRHVSALDIYIDVLKTVHSAPGELLVKCRVLSVWYGVYYETTSFKVNNNDLWKWELYTECQK